MGKTIFLERGKAMAVKAQVVGDVLKVEFSGQDRVWNLKTSLEVPVASISGANVNSADEVQTRLVKVFGKRLSPTHASGYFRGPDGDTEIWVVEGQDKVAVIDLHGAKYGKLVLGVADPKELVASIRQTIGVGQAGSE
jgi:hypothetical protein